MMHLEFVVVGTPMSNQQSTPAGIANLAAWKALVSAQSVAGWGVKSPLRSNLKAIIINFHLDNKPSVDVDNMSKPILDVLQSIVYDNDRQIRQAEITHVPINAPFSFVGASKLIVSAVQAGNQFVYVRIEDPVDPFPLPK